MAKVQKPYFLYQAKLYISLPYLIYQANQVRKRYPTPPSLSEDLILGKGHEQILVIGESTVAGVGASTTEDTLGYHLFDGFQAQFQIRNLGKNGILAKEVIPHFRKKLEKLTSPNWKGVFLYIGANDCFRVSHPTQFRKALIRLLEHLRVSLKPNWIYLADIPPVQIFPAFPNTLKSFLGEQREFLRNEMMEIAIQQKDIVFESIHLDLSEDFFSEDLVHPSGSGYKAIAEFSLEGLKRAGVY